MRSQILGVFLALVFALSGCKSSTTPSKTANYQGTWSGTYFVQNCTESGAGGAGFCASVFPTNTPRPITFQFTQANSQVSGTVVLGSLISNTFTAPIASDGSLRVIVQLIQSPFTFNTTWSLSITPSTTPTALGGTGSIAMIITQPLVGSGDVSVRLDSVTLR